jgi:hypothetical protein
LLQNQQTALREGAGMGGDPFCGIGAVVFECRAERDADGSRASVFRNDARERSNQGSSRNFGKLTGARYG